MVPQELLSFFFGMATFSGIMFNFWEFHRGVGSSESSTCGDQAGAPELFIAGDVVAKKHAFCIKTLQTQDSKACFNILVKRSQKFMILY